MSKYKYTEDNPLKVFTAFSGYDSQCLALDRIGIPYELVRIFENLFTQEEVIKETLF